MHYLQLFFNWPNGSVWGNLIASLLWSIPLWTLGYFKIKRQHAKHHQQLKDHIDYRFAKLTDETKE